MTKRILVFLMLSIAATPLLSQSLTEIRVTKKYSNEHLTDVIEDLSHSYNLSFNYVNQQVDTLKVTATIKDQTLEQGLKMILNKTSLQFYFRNDSAVVLFYNEKKSTRQPPMKNVYSIAGSIRAEGTKDPIPFVNVFIQNTQGGIFADEQGNYAIKNLPEGIYHIEYSCVGYTPVEQIVNLEENKTINISLKEEPLELNAVEITPNVYEIDLTEQSPIVLTEKEILHSPNLAKDVARTLRALPGIVNNDYSAKPRVRGGSADETVFYLDNLEIMDPYHFEEFGGLFSVINTDYISNVKVIPGGFKTSYTDKISGIIDIKSPSSIDENRATISVDLVNSTALVKQKITDKVDVQFCARRTYLDFILDGGEDEKVDPVYYDLWSKVNYRVNDKNSLSFNFLHGGDIGTATIRISNFNWIDMSGKKYNNYGWVNWQTLKNDRYHQTTTAGYQQLDKRTDFSFNNSISPDNVDDRLNRILLLTHTSLLKLGKRNALEFGGEVKHFSSHFIFKEVRYNNFESNEDHTVVDSINVDSHIKMDLAALFLQNTVTLSDRVNVMGGVRLSYFSPASPSILVAPRFAVSYQVNNKLGLRLGYGIYNQPTYPQQTRIFEGEETPSTDYKQSLHYMANATFSNNKTSIMLNAYYKDNRKLNDDYLYDVYNRLGGGIAILDKTFVTTSGFSKGLEVIFRQMYGHKSTVSVSYCYSINKIRNAEGLETYRDNDRRHTFIINNILNLKRHWTIGAYSMFYSGEPYTPSFVKFVGENGERQIMFYTLGPKNSERLPSYYSLDVKVDKVWYFKRFRFSAYFNFINLTGHDNVRNYFWVVNDGEKTSVSKEMAGYLSTVFISPGFSFSF